MPSTIASLVAELAAVHTVLDPIAAACNEACPGDAGYDDLELACREHWARSRDLVSAMVGREPQSARDALALALVVLDYAAYDCASGVGSDGTPNHLTATRALVKYLAREAGVTPAELGIFGEALAAAGLKDGPRATAN